VKGGLEAREICRSPPPRAILGRGEGRFSGGIQNRAASRCKTTLLKLPEAGGGGSIAVEKFSCLKGGASLVSPPQFFPQSFLGEPWRFQGQEVPADPPQRQVDGFIELWMDFVIQKNTSVYGPKGRQTPQCEYQTKTNLQVKGSEVKKDKGAGVSIALKSFLRKF